MSVVRIIRRRWYRSMAVRFGKRRTGGWKAWIKAFKKANSVP